MFAQRSGTALRRLRHTSVAAAAPTQLETHTTFVSSRPVCASGALRQREHESLTHAHRFLSASQVIRAQATTVQNSAAGLSVTLPPLCVLGACADAGSGSSSRYNDVWAPIESYLAQLSAAAAANNGLGQSGVTPGEPSPPLCLVLRLFPDLTIAQLPALRRGSTGGSRPPRRACNSFIAPHEYPLDAILGAEELWGGGADPQRVFRGAIDCLHELGQRLLPQLALVLQLPTRLLVSQQFLHDLAALLVRDSWRSISFELPSTHQLYSCSADRSVAGARAPSATSATDVGAVDTAWCQLPVLCTSWPTLCRHPALGRTLRQLRRHDVVPFHVLYSWAVAEMQLFHSFELSIVVDTTAPMPEEEALHAYLQGPSSVGRSAEELHRASPQLPHQFRDSTDVAHSSGQTDGDAHRKHRHVYMSDNPMAARGATVGLSNGVMNALRRRDRSAMPLESHKVDLDGVEKEWRLRKHISATSPSEVATAVAHTPLASSDSPSDLSLSLDTPPDHLRALIENSIVDRDAAARSRLAQRQRLLQKVGQLMQRTMEEPSVAASGDTDSPPSTSTGEDDQSASLKQEAEALERLLREANDASDAGTASFDAEMMMAEMQRYTRAHSQTSPSHRDVMNGMHDAPGADLMVTYNPWSAFPEYWSCVHALVEEVTRATLLWTAPTFNKAAVQAWTAAYYASQHPRVGEGETHVPTRNAPLPLVVPIYMPVQSAMHVEVERLLREGRWFENPPLLQGREEGTALHTWLPASLNVALADTLSMLPGDYQARERSRLLRDHQRLRKEGAQGARRGSSVSELAGSSPSCSESCEDDEELRPVLIRIHQEARPLFLLTPAQVERRESRAFTEAAAACVTAGAEAAQLDKTVRGANKTFTQAVEESYRAASPANDAVVSHKTPCMCLLHVPTPGLSVEELDRSWRCLSS
ncbi:hypothetical protein, unknown function [Leishmania mexicana MHOM/GT/2001/U1103]|uniref:Uncharacterized protein n=1 Tax=Leishmania mexicana (strain MHOM/GT/2001/U1103) TaxID=929439 RepID=E9B3R7_LEIMU|nr:hypothetical protein, unknown function [Leishmania mexicana MHOM/GT/2001/U1103]CBZ29884.1 hypothetical protein, unknown function [Leishmania mexicana MHOM/GT/2001/U1103]